MSSKRKYTAILIVILSLFVVAKVYLIEADLPSWHAHYYSQPDELFYSIGAFNALEPIDNIAASGLRENDYQPFSMFNELLLIPFIYVFGDNYVGLRMLPFLLGFLTIIIWHGIYKRHFGNRWALIVVVFMMTESGFQLATSSYQPTIFRLFWLSVVIFLIEKIPLLAKDNLKSVAMTALFFLVIVLPLMVYPTALFISVAALLYIVAHKKAFQTTHSLVFILILGFVLGIVAWMGCMKVFGVDVSQYLSLLDFKDRTVGADTSLLTTFKGLARNVLYLKDASYFKYNIGFLVLLLSAGAIALWHYFAQPRPQQSLKGWLQATPIAIWVLGLGLGQTLFVNDYPVKKLLVFLPLFLFVLGFSIKCFKEMFRGKVIAITFIGLMTGAICFNIYFSTTKIISNRTHYFKSAMIALQALDGKIVAGNLSYAFRLYNDFVPVVNYYRYKYTPEKLVEYENIMGAIKTDKHFGGSIFYIDSKYEDMAGILNRNGLVLSDTILTNPKNIPLGIGLYSNPPQ